MLYGAAYCADYTRTGQLTNDCPTGYAKIYDVATCQAAHEFWYQTKKSVNLWPATDIPSGCFYCPNSGDALYLNIMTPGAPMKQGAANSDALLYCAGALGPKPNGSA